MKPVRPSLIATARKSMLAYQYRRDHPMDPTPSMIFGIAVDAVLFGEGQERLEVLPSRRTKAADEAKASGKIVITENEWDGARSCADALRLNPAVKHLLSEGTAQMPIMWTDEETGLDCAGRPDFLSTSTGLVVDLKTTSGGLSDRHVSSTVERWGYGLQVAMYRMGLRANGIDLNPAFIFVESEPPYDSVVYALLPNQVDDLERDVRRLLRRIATCELTGTWPGVSDQIQSLSLPHWAFGPEIEENA